MGRLGLAEDSRFLYRNRRMLEGYPGLSEALERYHAADEAGPEEGPRVAMIVECLDRLIEMHPGRKILVVGCGRQPESMKVLREMGYEVTGVEPVSQVMEAARTYLGDERLVVGGSAEELPLESESQDVVMLESVLEHVDSVERSLSE